MENTKGFYILSKGDRPAGIMDTSWEISGDFNFNNKEELEAFKDELTQTFLGYTDPIRVFTLEEIKQTK